MRGEIVHFSVIFLNFKFQNHSKLWFSMSDNTHEKITRISDILEQVDKLNNMVDFHKNESKELSMMRQYQAMRSGFLEELKTLLTDFHISVKIDEVAAWWFWLRKIIRKSKRVAGTKTNYPFFIFWLINLLGKQVQIPAKQTQQPDNQNHRNHCTWIDAFDRNSRCFVCYLY